MSHERDAREFLDHLLEMNSTRVHSDVVDRVQESRRQFEVEIRKILHEVSDIAEKAIKHARKARAEGTAAVDSAFPRLGVIESEIRALRARPGNSLSQCNNVRERL